MANGGGNLPFFHVFRLRLSLKTFCFTFSMGPQFLDDDREGGWESQIGSETRPSAGIAGSAAPQLHCLVGDPWLNDSKF